MNNLRGDGFRGFVRIERCGFIEHVRRPKVFRNAKHVGRPAVLLAEPRLLLPLPAYRDEHAHLQIDQRLLEPRVVLPAEPGEGLDLVRRQGRIALQYVINPFGVVAVQTVGVGLPERFAPPRRQEICCNPVQR